MLQFYKRLNSALGPINISRKYIYTSKNLNQEMMKKIMMIVALVAFTTGIAQDKNTNTKEVEQVKKTYVTDSDGVKVKTETTEMSTNTDLALGKRTSYHNFNTIMKPTTANVDVDYSYDGTTYRFVKKNNGYAIVDKANRDIQTARLYPTSQKGYYIYYDDKNSSFGYFNSDRRKCT